MSLLAEHWVRAWGCTCCPLSYCSHRLLPRDPHGPTMGPSQALSTHTARQVAGHLQQFPTGYHGYQAAGGWGETLFSSALSVAPCGLCQNLPTMGEAGSEGPAQHTGSVSVCVWEGGVAMAVGAARGSLRDSQGRAGRLVGPGWLPSPQAA